MRRSLLFLVTLLLSTDFIVSSPANHTQQHDNDTSQESQGERIERVYPTTFASKHGRKHHTHSSKHVIQPWDINKSHKTKNVSELYTGATAAPIKARSIDDLPEQFDWCDVDGQSFCTGSWNQHVNGYCGSCYVHGALHAANDRIKILKGGLHDLMLARQTFINCGPPHGLSEGCDGGEGFDVFEFMHRFGLPDESCLNYEAKQSEECVPNTYCRNCMPYGEDVFDFQCWEVPNPIRYYADSYGSVRGEAAIMSEIYARGPVTCGFASVDDFDYNYRGGIYIDDTNATEVNHDVEIVGWGEENGIKYWKARNSWGSYWGVNSFFKIARGINNMQIESDCVFAILDTHMLDQVLDGKLGGSMYGLLKSTDAVFNVSTKHKPHKHQHLDSNKVALEAAERVIENHRFAAINSDRERLDPFAGLVNTDKSNVKSDVDPDHEIENAIMDAYKCEHERAKEAAKQKPADKKVAEKTISERREDEKKISDAMSEVLERTNGDAGAVRSLIQQALATLEKQAKEDKSPKAEVAIVEDEVRRAWKLARKTKNADVKDKLNDLFDPSSDLQELTNFEMPEKVSTFGPTVFGMLLGIGLSALAVAGCQKSQSQRHEYSRL